MSKIVFVGANSDVAQAAAELLPESDIIMLTRDAGLLPESIGGAYECHSCDPCDHTAVYDCFAKIAASTDISAVVNFCGSIMLKSAATLSYEDWKTTIDINLNTAFNVAHAATRLVKKDLSLVFFSTAAASIGLPNHEAIAAAKAGVEGLSRSIAATYAKQNIRSNVIAPGLVESKLSKMITSSQRGRDLSLSMHALNRLGQPADIARLLVWLLSAENDWITGEVIRLDGGLARLKSLS